MEDAFERRPWLVPLILALLTLVFLRPALLPLIPGEALNGSTTRRDTGREAATCSR